MKLLFFILSLVILSIQVQAEILEKGKQYRTQAIIGVKDMDGNIANNPLLKVGPRSRFIVLNNMKKNDYIIIFTRIFMIPAEMTQNDVQKCKQNCTKKKKDLSIPPVTDHCTNSCNEDKCNKECDNTYVNLTRSPVVEGKAYLLQKEDVNKIPISDFVKQSFGGLISGTLIVPFKYRLDDKSFEGSTTVGGYIGYSWDAKVGNLSYINIAPIFSAGLTQINVQKDGTDNAQDTENRAGFSLAGGILISNWDNITFGALIGQDRIGDTEWKHEGKTWVSISVGWEF